VGCGAGVVCAAGNAVEEYGTVSEDHGRSEWFKAFQMKLLKKWMVAATIGEILPCRQLRQQDCLPRQLTHNHHVQTRGKERKAVSSQQEGNSERNEGEYNDYQNNSRLNRHDYQND